MTVLDIKSVKKDMDKLKAKFNEHEDPPDEERNDIPPVHPDLLRHGLLIAKDDLEELFGQDETVNKNVANATLAAAIYHGIKRDKKGLIKRVRKMVTKEYALNMAYRLTSMMGMMGTHPEIDFRSHGADITNVCATIPLKAGRDCDAATFFERFNYELRNKRGG